MSGGKRSAHRRDAARKRQRLERKHKNWVHLLVVMGIAVTLLMEGGGMADWGFVALSALVELS